MLLPFAWRPGILGFFDFATALRDVGCDPENLRCFVRLCLCCGFAIRYGRFTGNNFFATGGEVPIMFGQCSFLRLPCAPLP